MEPGGWFFVFDQSARWHARGDSALLFRRLGKNKAGARALAIRSRPYDMPLTGPVVGVLEAPYGWQKHPVARVLDKHYPLLERSQ